MSYKLHVRTNTTNTTRRFPSSVAVFFTCCLCKKTPAVAMCERDGAAKRRRERPLRSWAKHERQTVAMALAEVLHHPAPRRPKTARAGVRPGVLEDPGPRRETEHELYAASRGPRPPSPGVPSLATPLLAGQVTEVLDTSTLAFLTRAVMEEKKKAEVEKEERMRRQRRQAEEHEERMLALNRRVRDDLPLTPAEHAAWKEWACRPLSSAGKRRKRKKKRKQKLPLCALPRHGCRRLCDHQRQVPAVRIPVMMQRQVPTVHSFLLPVQFLDTVLDMPVVVLRQVHGFMVQKTVVRPQLQFIVGRRHSFRAADADPHGPDCSADHGDSTVAAYFGGRCPCCAGRAHSLVLPWRRPWRSHSCSSLRNPTLSTALRIWQSLVRRSPLVHRFMDSCGR